MIENGPILTGNDAELLCRALAEVKTKFYEESETSLDDAQALDASFRVSELRRRKNGRKKDATSILAHWENALSLARYSTGKAANKSV